MPKIIIAYISNDQGHILLLHRNDRDEREPVKGGIEEGETLDQTMWREVREETGLMPDDIVSWTKEIQTGFVGAVYHLKTNAFHISINHDTSITADHDDRGRYTTTEAQTLSLHPGTKTTLASYRDETRKIQK